MRMPATLFCVRHLLKEGLHAGSSVVRRDEGKVDGEWHQASSSTKWMESGTWRHPALC